MQRGEAVRPDAAAVQNPRREQMPQAAGLPGRVEQRVANVELQLTKLVEDQGAASEQANGHPFGHTLRQADAVGAAPGNLERLDPLCWQDQYLHVVRDGLSQRETVLIDSEAGQYVPQLRVRFFAESERLAVLPEKPEDLVEIGRAHV